LAEQPLAYVEVSLSLLSAYKDVVCDFIIENIARGLILEEEDENKFVGIKFYIPQNGENDSLIKLQDFLDDLRLSENKRSLVLKITERVVKNIEWEEAYRKSVEPVVISKDVVIRPPWKEKPIETDFDIIIEPKMAFGTGNHETTRSCIRIVRKKFLPSMRFLDVGCGSGVLSILADKMNAGYIKAIDNDPLSVENCRENFILNKIQTPYDIFQGTIALCQNDNPYDFVCVNIIKSVILNILGEVSNLTAPNGFLVLSGLLKDDEQEVIAHLQKNQLNDFEILRENEWSTFLVYKK